MTPEEKIVLSFIRRDNEEPGDPVVRFFSHNPLKIQGKLGSLYRAIEEAANDDQSITPIVAAEILGCTPQELTERLEKVDPQALQLYIKQSEKQAENRLLQEIGRELQKDGDPEQALARLVEITARDKLSRIAQLSERSVVFLDDLQSRIEMVRNNEPRPIFPLPGLNSLVPFLEKGWIVLLSAGTKVGKSSFATQLATLNAKRGFKILYFHFEDSPPQIEYRRVAQQFAAYDQRLTGMYIPFSQMIQGNVSDEWLKVIHKNVADLNQVIGDNMTLVYCRGWTMEQVAQTWFTQHKKRQYDIVVVDYLNKASLTDKRLRQYGRFGARGQDVETVKQMTERTNTLTLLVSQENDTGEPYETREAIHKSQVWVSLTREREEDQSLNLNGKAVVKNANMGKTGTTFAKFYPPYMLWVGRN